MAVTVRYIVHDVNEAIPFYRDLLDFEVAMHVGPGFAMLQRGELRLLLNAPGAGGAGQPGKDGVMPAPGGWTRFQLPTDDIASTMARLEAAGVTFRTDLIAGNGGKQVLIEDPSGNVIEFLEPSPRRD